MWLKNVGAEVVINNTVDTLDVLRKDLMVVNRNYRRIYNVLGTTNKTMARYLECNMIIIATALSEIDEYISYIAKIKINYECANTELKESYKEIGALSTKLKQLKDINKEQEDAINKQNKEIEELKKLIVNKEILNSTLSVEKTVIEKQLDKEQQERTIYKEILVDAINSIKQVINSHNILAGAINKIINLVEHNIGNIATREFMSSAEYKEKAKNRLGEKHPRCKTTKKEDSDIIARYNKGESVKDIASAYRLSYQTIKNKLVRYGVYKNVYRKNNV